MKGINSRLWSVPVDATHPDAGHARLRRDGNRADGDRVEARKAFARGDTLVVQFDSAELNGVVDGSAGQVKVLGTYSDARYAADRSYWDGSVAVSDVTVFAPGEKFEA